MALAQVTQQLEWFNRPPFGRKSERHKPLDPAPGQGNLLADLAPVLESIEIPAETITYTRRKPKDRGNAGRRLG